MGYDISIDENGRTGKKPVLWEYQTERKSLVDIYTKLITLRTTHSDLFNASSQFTWKVSYNDWDNGRTLTLKAVNGKQLHVYANFTNASIDYTIPEGTWYLYLENGNPVEGEKDQCSCTRVPLIHQLCRITSGCFEQKGRFN